MEQTVQRVVQFHLNMSDNNANNHEQMDDQNSMCLDPVLYNDYEVHSLSSMSALYLGIFVGHL